MSDHHDAGILAGLLAVMGVSFVAGIVVGVIAGMAVR